MPDETRTVIFGEIRVPGVPADLSIDAVKTQLAAFYPSIANAEGAVDTDGNYVFTAKAGAKA